MKKIHYKVKKGFKTIYSDCWCYKNQLQEVKNAFSSWGMRVKIIR